ncbi:unnamed protein product [Coffea canephora]|uniref:Uncharacterized protein n=1 Tax=Coffea canephora TaxID=49390 RepID=A0A068V857_COFCA|nr:unnamed protein product [Coffea canephora]
MGKPGFARKRGLKRVNSSKPFKKFKNLKLNPGAEKLVPKQPLENDSGEPVLHFRFLLRIFFCY